MDDHEFSSLPQVELRLLIFVLLVEQISYLMKTTNKQKLCRQL